MKVVIEKTEDGRFFVSKENELESGMPEYAAQESQEQTDKQPARDIKEALMLAGKLLMMETGDSMFDQGVALTKPTPPPPRNMPTAGQAGGPGMMGGG